MLERIRSLIARCESSSNIVHLAIEHDGAVESCATGSGRQRTGVDHTFQECSDSNYSCEPPLFTGVAVAFDLYFHQDLRTLSRCELWLRSISSAGRVPALAHDFRRPFCGLAVSTAMRIATGWSAGTCWVGTFLFVGHRFFLCRSFLLRSMLLKGPTKLRMLDRQPASHPGARLFGHGHIATARPWRLIVAPALYGISEVYFNANHTTARTSGGYSSKYQHQNRCRQA
jgi:hypothetical protein